jgi:hypothetical protein
VIDEAWKLRDCVAAAALDCRTDSSVKSSHQSMVVTIRAVVEERFIGIRRNGGLVVEEMVVGNRKKAIGSRRKGGNTTEAPLWFGQRAVQAWSLNCSGN